jgi:hypothetical protein
MRACLATSASERKQPKQQRLKQANWYASDSYSTRHGVRLVPTVLRV